MRYVTFDFLGQYRHGTAFRQYLALRKRFFVDELGWDIPHDAEVEMDQYDNPCAHYALVLRGNRVVGGARTMPTSAAWGPHSYMLRDARRGAIDIPKSALPSEIVSPGIWECTRLVVSDRLRCHAERAECLSLVVEGLVEVVRAAGGLEMMSLSPVPLMRTLRQLGFPASRLGEPYLGSDGRRYAVLRMPAMRSMPAVMEAA